MLKWIEKLPLEVAQYIPEEYFGYGEYPRNLILEKNRIYTVKYSQKWGFLLNKYTEFLRQCLSDLAQVLNIAETGLFYWSHHYITLIPKRTISLRELISAIDNCIQEFRKRHWYERFTVLPQYESITAGDLIEAKKTEKRAATLPSWTRELALMGSLTVIGAVAAKTLIEKIKL